MALSQAQLRQIREEVGSSPDDATLDALFTETGNVTAVSLAVLRPRLADALAAAAAGGLTVPGAISFSAPAQPTMLLEQVQRLEGALAAETGDPEPDMGIGVTQLRRRSQSRGLAFRP